MVPFAKNLIVRGSKALLSCAGLIGVVATAQAAQVDLVGPTGSVAFGSQLAVLPNGNIVILDARDPAGGAAYLYSANLTKISKVTGILPGAGFSTSFDSAKIVVLKNGNYLITNPGWGTGPNAQYGMVAWGSKSTGISGVISSANALIGSHDGDKVGFEGITLLENGNYVVASRHWYNGEEMWAGASTWGNGTTGTSGPVSAANSLVGTRALDGVGAFTYALPNGNYVISSPAWSSDTEREVSAVTWANGATGITGTISATNSLIGSKPDDGDYTTVTVLTNGNYVVDHPYWNETRGAVILGNGASGTTGIISPANALVGAQIGNYVGYPNVVALTNGNYVVRSSDWEGPGQNDVGAVTWVNGITGLTGPVSAANSLVGDFDYEYVGDDPIYRNIGVLPLANGNYAVFTPRWGSNGKSARGAITWGNGSAGTTGTVSISNSLVGGSQDDLVGIAGGGQSAVSLSNGNFVAIVQYWHDAGGNTVGATVWLDGSKPTSGLITSGNSLRGASSVTPLSNGHYVASVADGVAWGDGTKGRTGVLNKDNAFASGGYAIALPGGNYVICNYDRNNGATIGAGALTWSDGNQGIIGEANEANSLVGTTAQDKLCNYGSEPAVKPLADGRYILYSEDWDNGSIVDADAVTLGIGPLSGGLSPSNTVMGTVPYAGDFQGINARGTFYAYDAPRAQVVVARPASNRITFLALSSETGPELSISDAAIDEGNSGTRVLTFTVQLSAIPATPVFFDIGTANASATDEDYIAMAMRGQTIPAGVASKSFTVIVNGDTKMESDERFTVNVSNVVGAKVVDAQAIGIIRNDDGSSLSIDDLAISEGNQGTRSMTFLAKLSAPQATPVTFDIATANGTAVAGQDYVAKQVNSLEIPAGLVEAEFTVIVISDEKAETDETFFVSISNAIGAEVARGTATGTLINDDFVTMSINDVATLEGNSGSHPVTFTVKLSAPVASDVTFTAVTDGGTANPGSDFQPVNLPGLVIPAGSTQKTIEVLVNGDTDVEADEFFQLYATQVSGPVLNLGFIAGAAFILNDEGATSMPTLSIADVAVSEGNNGTKLATFSILLSEASAATVTYDVSVRGETATSGQDFDATSPDLQRITPGYVGKSFSVPIFGDTTPEDDETFTVTLSNVVGAVPTRLQATGKILDDDSSESLPILSIENVTVAEGNTGGRAATFTATLSKPAPSTGVEFLVSTRDLAATNGAYATAGDDYASVARMPVVIAPGTTSKAFSIKVIGDTRKEANESFAIAIEDLTGAKMNLRSAQGTIIDDDDGPLLSGIPTNDPTPENVPEVSPKVAISAIQGRGQLSPMRGAIVVVQGIVTALRGNGFFIQSTDAEADADPATSEGLFVFAGNGLRMRARLGTRVEVSGLVQEAAASAGGTASMTMIAADRLSVVATDQRIPQPIVFNATKLRPGLSATWLERYEGMRISVPEMMVVAPVTGKVDDVTATATVDGNFFGVVMGMERPFRRPASLSEKLYSEQSTAATGRLRIESLGQTGSKPVSVDVGDVITGLVGVLAQGEKGYAVYPDASARLQVLPGATPRAMSQPLASDITIGQFNARRLFDSTDSPNSDEPVATASAYALRLAKTANAVCTYQRNPDILGISGIEGVSVLSDLAAAVNSGAGNELFPGACKSDPAYRAVSIAGNRGVGQMGFLVRSTEVRPGTPRVQVLATTTEGATERFTHPDGSVEDLFEYVPTLLRARVNESDGGHQEFVVVIVQLLTTEVVNDNYAVGTHGWTNLSSYLSAKRDAQLRFLRNMAARRQVANGAEKLILLGGFEGVEFRDARGDLHGLADMPMPDTDGNSEKRRLDRMASAAPLVNTTLLMPPSERYSAIRDGEALALDHVLVSSAMLQGQFRLRTEFARVNADFGEDNAGDFAVPVRVSDHDPVVLYLSKP